MHEELAEQHDGESKWGYRKLDTLQLGLNTTNSKKPQAKELKEAPWVQNVISNSVLGDKSTTSQVHPEQFTQAIADLSKAQGVDYILGSATGLRRDDDGKIITLIYERQEDGSEGLIDCTDVVLCAGPWTGMLAKKLFADEPSLKMRAVQGISGHRAHSVVVEATQPITAHAFFTSLRTPEGSFNPEYVHVKTYSSII